MKNLLTDRLRELRGERTDEAWKTIALSQQQTIAQLTKLLADAAVKKDHAKTPHAQTTGESSRAG